MGTAQAVSLLLAGSASVAGVVIVGVMWRRHYHRARAHRARHPSSRPPIGVRLVADGDVHRWRIDVRPGAPTMAIDIVSFRPVLPGAAWQSEPIVDPIVIESGGSCLMPSMIVRTAERFEVVIAWTARHASGDVQGSRTFDVPEPPPASRALAESPRAAVSWWPALVLAGLLAASIAVVAFSAAGAFDDGVRDLPQPTTTAVELRSTDVATNGNSTRSSEPAATPATATPAEAGTTTTSGPGPSSTAAAATTPAVASSPVAPGGPTISVEGRIGECRYADNCLIVSFTIDGFDIRPHEYVCEFEDGSRFTFRFDSDGVDDACATGTATAEITVEVDGVRSDTVTRADV